MLFTAANRAIKRDKQTGSEYWVVKMDNLMFTHFEVVPNKNFQEHFHESEQITYVLKGKLFFRMDGEVYCVEEGDCIAVPSGIKHEVWTENEGAVAVDSWSPVNNEY